MGNYNNQLAGAVPEFWGSHEIATVRLFRTMYCKNCLPITHILYIYP